MNRRERLLRTRLRKAMNPAPTLVTAMGGQIIEAEAELSVWITDDALARDVLHTFEPRRWLDGLHYHITHFNCVSDHRGIVAQIKLRAARPAGDR